MLTLPPCPLCSAHATSLTRELHRASVIAEWQRLLSIDISREMPGVDPIAEWRCGACGFEFFPAEAAGTGALYESLQTLSWYYGADKWENHEALRDIADGMRVCEAGCGRGDFLARLAENPTISFLGLELNEDAVRQATSRGLPAVARSLESLAEAEPESRDVVCSFQVLEHVPDPGQHLRAAHRLLRPGGLLLIGLPNQESFLRDEDNILDRPPHHVSRWFPSVLERALPGLGFRVRRCVREPLNEFHVRSFLIARLGRPWIPRPIAWLLRRGKVLNALEALVVRTGLHHRFTGQTFYVAAEKVPGLAQPNG